RGHPGAAARDARPQERDIESPPEHRRSHRPDGGCRRRGRRGPEPRGRGRTGHDDLGSERRRRDRGGGRRQDRFRYQDGAVELSDAPNGVAVGGGFVWVISSTTGKLYMIDPTQAHAVKAFTVPNGAQGIALGAGGVWITSNFDDRVLRLDPQHPDGGPDVVQLEAGAGPEGIAVGGGAVWVAEGLKGKVARIDPSTMRVTSEVPLLKGNPNEVAFGEGYVWVSDT